MKAPVPIDPVRALQALAARLHPQPAIEYAIDEAPRGYTAEAIPAPAPERSERGRVALRNGFALPPGIAAGDECAILGTIAVERTLDAFGRPLPAPVEAPSVEGRNVWRVETGATVPAGAASILPAAHATLVAPDRIRIGEVPRPGDGLEPANISHPTVPPGSPLDARLRTFLAGASVRTVRVRPPFEVGVACIGDEIMDLHAPGEGGRHDLVMPWIEEGITRLDLTPVPLGILGDAPEELRRILLHVMDRKVEVLILVGGLGDGITDRVRESLSRFDAPASIDGVAADGCRSLLLARAVGIDVVALGGRAGEAAAVFDLLVRPALLARRGAGRPIWDWTRTSYPLAPTSTAAIKPAGESSWIVRPACVESSPRGEPCVRAWDLPTPFLPLAPPQEGWAVIPPGAGRAHFGRT